MTDDHEMFRELLQKKQHGIGGRAIIFDSTRRRVLVERNLCAREEYVNFPGGGIEVGETLQECISREMDEEIGAEVVDFKFLFLVENFILFEGEYVHGIELYCEVKLGSDEVESQIDGYEFHWVEVTILGGIDLRPTIVRDRIIDGTYRDVRHLVSRG